MFPKEKALSEVSSFSRCTGNHPPGVFSLSKSGCFQGLVLPAMITDALKTCLLKSGGPMPYHLIENQLPSELDPPLVTVALPFDLPDVRKEKRLMRRREKLPDFLWLLVAAAAKLLPMLEMSSWDWLRQDSFSRCLLRNSSFDPLCRKPTAGSRQNIVEQSSSSPKTRPYQMRHPACSFLNWFIVTWHSFLSKLNSLKTTLALCVLFCSLAPRGQCKNFQSFGL